jgi:hypothetical protein
MNNCIRCKEYGWENEECYCHKCSECGSTDCEYYDDGEGYPPNILCNNCDSWD